MPSVFITYRRADTAGHAGRLADRLKSEFGASNVFMDVDAIVFGQDFTKRIEEGVGSCDVLLVLIGDQWLTVKDDAGRRRLDDPEDFIRLEVETGLERDVWVIPVLVEGARLPEAKELPESMAKLARHQAIELRNTSWREDVDRLVKAIWRLSTKPGVRSNVARIRAKLGAAPATVRVGGPILGVLAVGALVLLSVFGSGGGAKIVGGDYSGTTSQGKTCQPKTTKADWATGPRVPCQIRLTFSSDRKRLVDLYGVDYNTTCAGHKFSGEFHHHKINESVIGSRFTNDIGLATGQRAHLAGKFTGPNNATGTFTTKNDSFNGVACESVSVKFTAHA